MTEDVILELCPVKLNNINVEKPSDITNAVSYDEVNKLITIEIMPVDAPPPTGEVIVPILQGNNEDYLPPDPDSQMLTTWLDSSSVPYYCETDTWIWWEHEQDETITGFDGVHPLKDFPTLYVRYPECCHFTGLQVKLFGPEECGIYGKLLWEHKINVSEKGGTIYGEDITNNIIVPGMMLAVFHTFSDGNTTKEVLAGSTYWCTCCFTGGIIKNVIGEYGDPAIIYNVEVEKKDIPCKPSDFARYEVGDWVFVQKANDKCEETERNEGCKNGCIGEDAMEANTLLKLINDARAGHGLGPLLLNQKLNSAAQKHSKDQVTHCFMDHIGSDGSTPETRITATGYFENITEGAGGENVCLSNNIINAFKAWKNSPGHWANILNPKWQEMGFGTASYSECAILKDNYHGTTIDVSITDPKTGEKTPADHGLKNYTNTFGYVEKDPNAPPDVFRIVPLRIGNYGD